MTATVHNFIEAICADPDSDDLRLVFADWLEENGEADRAEFVHLDVERHRRWPDFASVSDADRPERYPDHADLKAIEQRMFRLGAVDRWKAWVPAYLHDPLKTSFQFRRGLVEEITLSSRDWWTHGPALARATPLRRVTLTDKRPIRTAREEWSVCRCSDYLPSSWSCVMPECFPSPVWRCFQGGRLQSATVRVVSTRTYVTEEEARNCISASLLQWARQRKRGVRL